MQSSSKHTLLKIFSMFSVVRGYNIGLIVLAQYLTSIFIFAPDSSLVDVLFDPFLLAIILATAGAVASGYIINNFYDQEKDVINRPQKFVLDRMVSQQTKLKLYFVLNFLVLLSASAISFRAVLFFVLYIFAIWFYSHKIKRMPVLGNLTSALLSIIPFFAIFLYFKNYTPLVYVFGFYLFLVLATRELIKDLESIKGDLALDYKTVPVVYGERRAKWMITLLVLMNIMVSLFLVLKFDLGLMNYFFFYSILILIFALILTWLTSSQKHYNTVHNFLKLLVFLGVLSIALLNPELIINQIF